MVKVIDRRALSALVPELTLAELQVHPGNQLRSAREVIAAMLTQSGDPDARLRFQRLMIRGEAPLVTDMGTMAMLATSETLRSPVRVYLDVVRVEGDRCYRMIAR